jgi:hypothetical protein
MKFCNSKQTLIFQKHWSSHMNKTHQSFCKALLNGRGKKKNHQHLGLQVLPGEENGQSSSTMAMATTLAIK